MPIRSAHGAVALLLALTLAACGDAVAVPKTFGPLELGEPEHCSIVNGRFEVQEPIVRWAVVERVLPYDSTRGEVDAFSLLGNADQSLRLVAWSDGVARDTVRLTRDREYRCSERRVVLDLPDRLPLAVHESVFGTERGTGRLTRTTTLALAVGAEGALTVELAHTTYAGFPVWCGDGCKYIPVPFSTHTTHQWTRVYPLPEDGQPRPRRWASPEEQQRMDRVAAEERALEMGLPLPARGASDMLRDRARRAEEAVENGRVPPPA